MSRRTRESPLSDRVIQEPPAVCIVSNMEGSAGVYSVSIRPPDESSRSPSLQDPLSTPKKSATSIVRAEVDSIGAWSDTLSVNVNVAPTRKSSESMSEEKKSLLELRKPSSRRGSSTVHPASPRPGSRGSRRSRDSRRRKGSKEGLTRGEILMELARHDSVKSRDSRGKSSTGNRDSQRGNTQSKQRKNSVSTSTSSATSASIATSDGVGGAFPRKGRRGYMTAKDAVELGDHLCGCVLKAKLIYFIKPFIFLTFGTILISGGLALTVLHFLYEDSLKRPKNEPFFTYGTITLSTGVILFMVGLVWIPIKEQKWKEGKASPMLEALAKWRLENLEKDDLQMADLGEVKVTTSKEDMDETTLVKGPSQCGSSEEDEENKEKPKEDV